MRGVHFFLLEALFMYTPQKAGKGNVVLVEKSTTLSRNGFKTGKEGENAVALLLSISSGNSGIMDGLSIFPTYFLRLPYQSLQLEMQYPYFLQRKGKDFFTLLQWRWRVGIGKLTKSRFIDESTHTLFPDGNVSCELYPIPKMVIRDSEWGKSIIIRSSSSGVSSSCFKKREKQVARRSTSFPVVIETACFFFQNPFLLKGRKKCVRISGMKGKRQPRDELRAGDTYWSSS